MGLFHISSPKLKCFGAEMDFGAKKNKISRNVLMKVNFVCRVKFILSNCLCFGHPRFQALFPTPPGGRGREKSLETRMCFGFYFFVFFVRFFLRLCGLTSELGKRPHSRRLVVFSLSPFVNPNEGRSHLVRKSIRSEALYLLSCCGGMWMAL